MFDYECEPGRSDSGSFDVGFREQGVWVDGAESPSPSLPTLPGEVFGHQGTSAEHLTRSTDAGVVSVRRGGIRLARRGGLGRCRA